MVQVLDNIISVVFDQIGVVEKTLGIDHLDQLYENTINYQFKQVNASIGVPIDLLKLVVALLMTYPLALIHKNLPSTTLRHFLNILGGLSMLIMCYGPLGWIHVFMCSALCYFILAVFPPKRSPVIIFVFSFLYILFMHLLRMYINVTGVYELDYTTPQMFLIVRLTSLAYNYRDGNVGEADLRKEWIPYRIKNLPSILEFFSFAFYFGGIIIGPAFEYTHFISWNEGTLYESAPEKKMPSTWIPCLRRVCHAIICLALNLYLTKTYFPTEYLFTKEFAEHDIVYKWVYSVMALIAVRFGYFFSFCLAEASNILSGFGFNGYDEEGKIKWDRLAGVAILKVEFAESPREISTHWNITVGHWLKHYVYLRAGSPAKPPPGWAVTTTNLLSGLWHGFYPGYFVHFGTAAFLVELARRTRSKLRPLFDQGLGKRKKVYDIIGVLVIKCMMGYSMACFVGLSWEKNMAYLTSMHFSGHIFCVLCMIIITFAPFRGDKKKTN